MYTPVYSFIYIFIIEMAHENINKGGGKINFESIFLGDHSFEVQLLKGKS